MESFKISDLIESDISVEILSPLMFNNKEQRNDSWDIDNPICFDFLKKMFKVKGSFVLDIFYYAIRYPNEFKYLKTKRIVKLLQNNKIYYVLYADLIEGAIKERINKVFDET